MDAYVLNNYGFKTGFHGKNLVLIWFFEHYGLVFQPSKNLATLSSSLDPDPLYFKVQQHQA